MAGRPRFPLPRSSRVYVRAQPQSRRSSMIARLRRSLTFANVASFLALTIALGTGSAYAANTVFSTDIVDGEVKTPDIANAGVTNGKLAGNSIQGAKIADGTLTTVDFADAAVTDAKIGDGAVTSTKLGDGAVTNFKLGSGVVTHSKLGPDSIDGSNVAANSLSLSDIVGANTSGAISFTLGANACGNLSLGVPGAQVGQVLLFSFTGSTAIPATVVFGGVRVTGPGAAILRACNVGASSVSVSGLGIRVVTFG